MAIQYFGNTISGTASNRSGMTNPTANEVGILFLETDTGKVYQWDGDSWEEIVLSDASTSAKGIASFHSDNFAASSGAITIKDGGVILGTETTGNYVATVAGTSNEVDVSASTGAVTIGLPNDVTIGQDLVVTRNLTVSGTTVTANVTNLTIEDPLLYLANGQSSSPAFDSGFVVERGSSTNVAFIWDESADEFVVANVPANEVGTTAGNVTIDSYAALKAGTIDATTDFTIGDTVITDGVITDSSGLSIVANTAVTGTLSASGLISANGGITTSAGDLTLNPAASLNVTLTVDDADALTFANDASNYYNIDTRNTVVGTYANNFDTEDATLVNIATLRYTQMHLSSYTINVTTDADDITQQQHFMMQVSAPTVVSTTASTNFTNTVASVQIQGPVASTNVIFDHAASMNFTALASGAGTATIHDYIHMETQAQATTSYMMTMGNSDADQNLIHVGVTGNPMFWWDESEDAFAYTKGMQIDESSRTLVADANSYQVRMKGTNVITGAGSGTHGLIANLRVDPLNITKASGGINDTATVYIAGAATEGTANVALWVDSGTTRLDGDVDLNGTADLLNVGAAGNDWTTDALTLNGGSAAQIVTVKTDATDQSAQLRLITAASATGSSMVLFKEGSGNGDPNNMGYWFELRGNDDLFRLMTADGPGELPIWQNRTGTNDIAFGGGMLIGGTGVPPTSGLKLASGNLEFSAAASEIVFLNNETTALRFMSSTGVGPYYTLSTRATTSGTATHTFDTVNMVVNNSSSGVNVRLAKFATWDLDYSATTALTDYQASVEIEQYHIGETGGAFNVSKSMSLLLKAPRERDDIVLIDDAALWISDCANGTPTNLHSIYIETNTASPSSAYYHITLGSTDADQNLIHVGVNGDPRFWWDESLDAFSFTHHVAIAATEALYMDGGGNTYIHESSADVLGFVVNGTTRLQLDTNATFSGNVVISTSGKGIDYSAYTGEADASGQTAELLDDYEEGTWTPVPVLSGGNGDLTTNVAVGTYTKVGRLVHVQGRIRITDDGSGPSGNYSISGLPFTTNSTGNNYFGIWASNQGFGDPAGGIQLFLAPGVTVIDVYKAEDNAWITHADIGTNSTLSFTFSYDV